MQITSAHHVRTLLTWRQTVVGPSVKTWVQMSLTCANSRSAAMSRLGSHRMSGTAISAGPSSLLHALFRTSFLSTKADAP